MGELSGAILLKHIYIFSTEGHQSAVFKANFMQFSKLIWYYLM